MTNIVCTVDIVKEDSDATMKTAKIGNETWYLIETEAQLRSIATDSGTLSRKYIQNADIHMTSVWSPIGDEYHPFTGIYNGNAFAISGLRYQENGSKYRGLFGYSEGAEMTGITIVGLGTGPIVSINISGKGAHDNVILSQEAYQGKVVDDKKQTVSLDAVEIRKYDDGAPYIHDIITNNANRKIVSYERGMLAYNKNGQPLKLQWNGMDSSSTPSYYFLYDWGSEDIPAGQTKNIFGGWSLFSDWNAVQNPSQETQPYKDIAYVLYNFKQITFEDGTVWKNPDYENWLKTYEGKQADLNSLNRYYPYSCIIE